MHEGLRTEQVVERVTGLGGLGGGGRVAHEVRGRRDRWRHCCRRLHVLHRLYFLIDETYSNVQTSITKCYVKDLLEINVVATLTKRF